MEPTKSLKSLKTAAMLGGLGGVALLISLFLPWYKDDVGKLPEAARGNLDVESYNAFEGLERTDIMLAVVAGLAILVAIAAMSVLRDPGALGWTLTGIGLAGVLLVLYRGSELPKPKVAFGIETSLQFGWYLGLVASAVVVAGGVVALRQRPPREYDDEDEDEFEDLEREDERQEARPADSPR